MAGTSSVNNQPKTTASSGSSGSSGSQKTTTSSTDSSKSGSVSSDRQASSANKVDVSSSKASDASKRISDSQISDGKFKATSETSVGALAQKLNDDGKGNVDSDAVKQSVKDIVNNNSALKEAAKDLDPNDPDYVQKLADIKIKEGEDVSVPESKTDSSKSSDGSDSSGDASGADGSSGGGSSGGADGAGESAGASGSQGTQGTQNNSNNQTDQITQLVQAAVQAIANKDPNAATQLLSQIQSMITDLENASGGQTSSGTPSDKANQSVSKINSGQSLSDTDKKQITDILKSGTPTDKIAVLKALQSKLQNVANQNGLSSNTGNNNNPFQSMDNQAIYNLAGLNMNGGIGNIGSLKTSGNVNLYSAA